MQNIYHGPLTPSPNCIVYHDELCDFWLDEDGILCGVAKNVKRTIELQKSSFALIRRIIGDTKVCYLSDANNTGAQDQECRKHANKQIPVFFKAIGFSASSSLGQLVSNTFLTFSAQSVPMRIFDNHVDAKNWLKNFV